MDIPIYSLLVLLFFVPSILLVLIKARHLNKKKLTIVLILCVVATIIWDTIAIRAGLWGFWKENVSWWLAGIPLEEYVFGLWLPIVVLGIYTSLPRFKKHSIKEPHLKEVPLLCLVFTLQFLVIIAIFINPVSYFKWLLLLAIIPSVFYLWRKGEKIDEVKLIITCISVALIVLLVDHIFVPLGAWYYGEVALIGRIGYIYWDDILFGIFNSIVIVGFYTSLPSKDILTRKW